MSRTNPVASTHSSRCRRARSPLSFHLSLSLAPSHASLARYVQNKRHFAVSPPPSQKVRINQCRRRVKTDGRKTAFRGGRATAGGRAEGVNFFSNLRCERACSAKGIVPFLPPLRTMPLWQTGTLHPSGIRCPSSMAGSSLARRDRLFLPPIWTR